MPRAADRLTVRTVSTLKRAGFHADGRGLYLQVSGTGAKSWVFRFNSPTRTYPASDKDGNPHKAAGRPLARWMGLGSVVDVPLANARERAREARRLLAAGVDPIEHQRALEAEQGLSLTFQEAAERYIAAHRPGWKNEKHAEQWPATLKTYAYPKIGTLAVQQVDTPAVLSVLEDIWTEIPETAGRLRGRIEAVLDWARARGHRSGENPARWKGHLRNLLPARKRIASIKHHPALPYGRIGALMPKLRELTSTAARALEFTILCASRTIETRGALWSEIDLQAKVWTIPASRMKGGREHRVPLSERAVQILREMQERQESDLVFPGRKRNKPMSENTMLKVLASQGGEDFTVHGFRSSFRDWAAEQTNYPNHVAEMALAHAIGDRVEASYRRGDLFEKRRRMMAEWARYCETAARSGGVVAINASDQQHRAGN